MLSPETGDGMPRPVDQNIRDGGLERGGGVRNVRIGKRRTRQGPDRADDCGLEAGEGKIAIVATAHRPGKGEPGGVSAPGSPFHRRSAGIGQAKQFGGLVESFADGVVQRTAIARILPRAVHRQQFAMAAGHEQQQIGEWQAIRQPRRQCMAFQMVDRHQRQSVDEGDGFCRHHADQHAADQPRPARRGDSVEIRKPDPGLFHRPLDDSVHVIEVAARGNFRHDAAIGAMFVDLREHDVGQDAAVFPDHRGCGFVAGGFNAENDHDGAVVPRGRVR